MRLTRLAIASATLACAAAIGVAIWKRAGSATTPPPGRSTADFDKFWTKEHKDEPEPVTLIDR
jgi:hypothetical protein